ncbi:MAG: ABC transporter permease [Acidobacteria bacterium]|nr:ABC transporter permease [Acidobacteriota bacterium]
MRKVLIIAIAELEQAVRSKAFLIGLLSVPLLMVLAFAIQTVTARRDTSERRFAILDRTGVVAPLLVEATRSHNTEATSPAGRRTGPHFAPEVVAPSNEPEDAARLALSDRVRKGELFAFVEIPVAALQGDAEAGAVRYFSQTPTYQTLPDWLRREVSRIVGTVRLERLGVDRTQATGLLAPLPLTRRELVVRGPDGTVAEAATVDVGRAILVPSIAMFVLFGLVMSSAPQLLNSVIEEKTSRISEVLLGSVSAFQLMLGKLLGSVAVTLTLAAVYLGSGLVALAQVDYMGVIPWGILPWFALFLVIAVVLYGSLFIAIGAACSEIKDAQGMMTPAIILTILPLLVWIQVVQNPDGAIATGFSLVPFWSPYLMLMRLALPPGPPLWQLALAVVGSVATTIAIVWAAGRILRVGLLMQGKTASYREMARWIGAR